MIISFSYDDPGLIVFCACVFASSSGVS